MKKLFLLSVIVLFSCKMFGQKVTVRKYDSTLVIKQSPTIYEPISIDSLLEFSNVSFTIHTDSTYDAIVLFNDGRIQIVGDTTKAVKMFVKSIQELMQKSCK